MAFVGAFGGATGVSGVTNRASSFASSRQRPSRRRGVVSRRGVRASLAEKFGHLRGKDIPSVSDTMQEFADRFGRPVPIVYRALVNEFITTTHLSVVCALWQYDALFALGFEHTFETFLGYYPDAAERETLRVAVAQSLKQDPARLAADATAVLAWADGCDEDALFAKFDAAGEGDAHRAVVALRAPLNASKFEFYYSRCFGIGLIALMQKVGTEVSIASAERWANKIGLGVAKFSAEVGVYTGAMERLKQAEQIYAEAAAREAKKTADRLAKRAEAAAKKLEELEKGESADDADSSSSSSSGGGGTPEPAATAAVKSEDKSST